MTLVAVLAWIGLGVAVALLFLAGAAAPARAAGLDGRWCAPDGRQIAVSGLAVVTPAGQRTSGRYNQQAFAFVMPANEWDAGKTVWMELKSPDSARVSVAARDQQGPPPHDLWRRCDHISGLPVIGKPRAVL